MVIKTVPAKSPPFQRGTRLLGAALGQRLGDRDFVVPGLGRTVEAGRFEDVRAVVLQLAVTVRRQPVKGATLRPPACPDRDPSRFPERRREGRPCYAWLGVEILLNPRSMLAEGNQLRTHLTSRRAGCRTDPTLACHLDDGAGNVVVDRLGLIHSPWCRRGTSPGRAAPGRRLLRAAPSAGRRGGPGDEVAGGGSAPPPPHSAPSPAVARLRAGETQGGAALEDLGGGTGDPPPPREAVCFVPAAVRDRPWWSPCLPLRVDPDLTPGRPLSAWHSVARLARRRPRPWLPDP